MTTRVDIAEDPGVHRAGAPHVSYVTDVEGQWAKLESFCRDNPSVTLTGTRLDVTAGHTFVFGGDTIDRGPHGRRVLRTLLDAKRRAPRQVILLAGNRDINKLRLARELTGHLPRRAPPEAANWPLPELLRFILDNTMGAKGAFAYRLTELLEEGPGVSDGDVVQSFLDDVRPGGLVLGYLREAQLAYRAGGSLFVHGGITSENLGVVPAAPARQEAGATDLPVDAWITALNGFYARELDAFEGGERCEALIAYQAPVPGTRQNQASVVYGRPTDDLNNPVLPPVEVRQKLTEGRISRVVVGHTPIGDVPCVLRHVARERASALEVVWADCSRGRDHESPRISLSDALLTIDGHAVLDSGERVHHRAELDARTDPEPLARTLATGHTVRSRLDDGRYFVSRLFEGFRNEQLALSEDDVRQREARGEHEER